MGSVAADGLRLPLRPTIDIRARLRGPRLPCTGEATYRRLRNRAAHPSAGDSRPRPTAPCPGARHPARPPRVVPDRGRRSRPTRWRVHRGARRRSWMIAPRTSGSGTPTVIEPVDPTCPPDRQFFRDPSTASSSVRVTLEFNVTELSPGVLQVRTSSSSRPRPTCATSARLRHAPRGPFLDRRRPESGSRHPDTIDLTELGVLDDRRFFLADDTNRLIDQIVIPDLVRNQDPHGPRGDLPLHDLPGQPDNQGPCVHLADAVETPMRGRTGSRPHRRQPVDRAPAQSSPVGREPRPSE